MLLHRCAKLLPALLLALLIAQPAVAQDAWTHRGGTPARNSVASAGTAPALDAPRWIAVPNEGEFVGQSAPVVHDGRVFAHAWREVEIDGDWVPISSLVAIDEAAGTVIWQTDVGEMAGDSWSAPTVDAERGWVLIATVDQLTAVEAGTGAIAWQTPLGGEVVNGTVCVADTLALVSTFGTYGELIAVNLDTESPAYQPGDIFWQRSLGYSSGTEVAVDPAMASRLVATDSDGYLQELAPDNTPGWTYAVPGAGPGGWYSSPYGTFFGGCVIDDGQVFAATYNFSGTGDNSLLCCVDAVTGAEVWTAPCERTDVTPLVAADVVLLSAGLDGFGSVPKLQAFRRSDGQKLWEYAGAGGWTILPVLVGSTLYVGVSPSGGYSFGPCPELVAIDITKTPQDAGFIVESYLGCGSSPAYASGSIYTVGAAGLYAFGPPPGQGDPLEISAAVEPGQEWVYQNAPATTADGHRSTVTVTLQSEAEPGEAYAVTLDDGDPDEELFRLLPEAVTRVGDELVLSVRGGWNDATTASTTPRTVTVTVTGQTSGQAAAAEVSLTLRLLCDVDGDGSVGGSDKQMLNNRLNGLIVPGATVRACDLSGDGSVGGSDKQMLNNRLNGVAPQ